MKKILLLSIALLTIISCETGEVGSSGTAHIYAVGNDAGQTGFLTKDGVTTSLGTGYFVMDLFVHGNDVYTSGNQNGIAAYTKNGVLTLLGTTTASVATNIFVNGDDVYVVGSQDQHPAYWKNGVVTLLSTDSGFKGVAYDIVIKENNVYVGGYQHNWSPTNPITNILYWKNGTQHTLYSSHVYSFNWLGEISIAVNDDNVYMAVNERDNSAPFNGNAYLITNGLQETLIDDNAEVHDIFISGSDIYLCGSHIESNVPSQAVVWKNGEVVVEKDVQHGAFASVFVAGNNLFAVGIDANTTEGMNHATTLINNVFETVPDFGASGYASGYVSVVVTQ